MSAIAWDGREYPYISPAELRISERPDPRGDDPGRAASSIEYSTPQAMPRRR